MIEGLQNLRRYFELIVFQYYLQSIEPHTLQSLENENIETFVKDHPGTCHLLAIYPDNQMFVLFLVIKTFEKELIDGGIDALKPLERANDKTGVADPDEVSKVVMNRSGNILSASTIIKSDFFSNLQIMTLPE